jgi:hypothetical protein
MELFWLIFNFVLLVVNTYFAIKNESVVSGICAVINFSIVIYEALQLKSL